MTKANLKANPTDRLTDNMNPRNQPTNCCLHHHRKNYHPPLSTRNESDHKVGCCVKNQGRRQTCPRPVIMVVVIIPVVNVVVLVGMTPPLMYY